MLVQRGILGPGRLAWGGPAPTGCPWEMHRSPKTGHGECRTPGAGWDPHRDEHVPCDSGPGSPRDWFGHVAPVGRWCWMAVSPRGGPHPARCPQTALHPPDGDFTSVCPPRVVRGGEGLILPPGGWGWELCALPCCSPWACWGAMAIKPLIVFLQAAFPAFSCPPHG